MPIRYRLKKIAEDIPAPIGRLVAVVPFEWRFGHAYSFMGKMAREMDRAQPARTKEWAFPKLKRIVENTYQNNLCYRTICQRHGFHPERFATFEHFEDAPIVTKSDLREFDLDDRSIEAPGRMLINTGGTSGEPLAFYVDRQAFAREWAHMHLIWKRAGYHYRDVKLTMRGRNIGNRILKYNPIHNEWILNTYGDRKAIFSELSALMDRTEIRWVHGYPSIVSEMVSDMSAADGATAKKLRSHLKGVLLGSEFPAAQYVEPIRRLLGVEPTAWYGHSEMCVLAYDKGQNHYIPLYSYGFVEAEGEHGNQRRLGTSYWNAASPFIRYDTGDRISADIEQGIVRSFSVADGRTGDFVVDSEGRRIALTALIFGRHHTAFSKIRHVQVRQLALGKIELLVVRGEEPLAPDELLNGFDFTNVALAVTPVFLDEPIRTESGKIRLLVQ
jgi:phenylacetate-CoA ligase